MGSSMRWLSICKEFDKPGADRKREAKITDNQVGFCFLDKIEIISYIVSQGLSVETGLPSASAFKNCWLGML